jgi:hypothetical protein
MALAIEIMTKRDNPRFWLCVAAAILSGVMAKPVAAQTTGSLRVTSIAPILETARGDAFVLGTVTPGTLLEVLDQQDSWYLVRSSDDSTAWRSGWIHDRYIEVLDLVTPPDEDVVSPLGTSVRGFVQAGINWFTAADSFEAVTGESYGFLYGGGGYVGLGPFFAQASVDRHEDTGQRVFVFNDQLFELGISNTVTVTPIQVTAGYRQVGVGGLVGYIGGGAGVMLYKEESAFALPEDNVDESFASYHILGGAEWPLSKWLWIGGEAQWTYVPDSIGEQGISAAFEEDDLGGVTLRVKLSVGY